MGNRKIGILGGTFNPVHNGHVELGLRIRETFGLDRIFYILSAHPPHKDDRSIPAAKIRYRMLEEALRAYGPYLVPCDIELHRQEPSYTIDTIRELRNELPGCPFFFISGSEGFLKIRTWRDYRSVMHLVFFIIVIRRSAHRRMVIDILNQEGIPHRDGPGNSGLPPMAFLFAYPSPYLLLSSTKVRRIARSRGDTASLVDWKVKAIMEDNHLYEIQ